MVGTIKSFCNHCHNETNHQILKQENRRIDYDDVPLTVTDEWQIISCLGCEEVSFRHVNSSSEMYDPETGEYYDNVTLYPFRKKDFIISEYDRNVPYNVSLIYTETINAYNNGLYILCAAGLRAVIEGICKNEGIEEGEVEWIDKNGNANTKKSKDLIGKINGLSEKGIITKSQASILHEHRFIGNTAIHELHAPPKELLRLAIEIVDHIIGSLYKLDKKAQRLIKERQAQERKKQKTTN